MVRRITKFQRDNHNFISVDICRTVFENDSSVKALNILSGDQDFLPAMKYAVERGCKVNIWAFENSIAVQVKAFVNANPERVTLFLLDSCVPYLQYQKCWHIRQKDSLEASFTFLNMG